MRLSEMVTPQDAASARARAARLLAAGQAIRGGCRDTGSEARRYHVCLVALLGLALGCAFVFGLAFGLGIGSGSLSEPSVTSDVVAEVGE